MQYRGEILITLCVRRTYLKNIIAYTSSVVDKRGSFGGDAGPGRGTERSPPNHGHNWAIALATYRTMGSSISSTHELAGAFPRRDGFGFGGGKLHLISDGFTG